MCVYRSIFVSRFRFINIALQYRIRNIGVNTISLPAAIYVIQDTKADWTWTLTDVIAKWKTETEKKSEEICFCIEKRVYSYSFF